jgi:hypothetical protein
MHFVLLIATIILGRLSSVVLYTLCACINAWLLIIWHNMFPIFIKMFKHGPARMVVQEEAYVNVRQCKDLFHHRPGIIGARSIHQLT